MVYKQAGGALSQFSLSLLCVFFLCLPQEVGVRATVKCSTKAFVHLKSKYAIIKHGNTAKIRRIDHRLQVDDAGDAKLTLSTRDWFGKWKVTKCFLNRDWKPGMVCALNYTRLDVGVLWCSLAQHNKIKGISKTFNFRSKKIAKAWKNAHKRHEPYVYTS